MNTRTGLYLLIGMNLALLTLVLVQQVQPAFAAAEPGMLRGRGLEIVDSQGRVRASISIIPPERSASGVDQPETVLLRLITERGRPSVKIAATERSSGLSFAGPTGTRDTYVILQAEGNVSSLKLRNENGHEQVTTPDQPGPLVDR